MGHNRGQTSLKCKRSSGNPMREFDRLPAPLRAWLATADLPWRAKSVQRAYGKALARTGDPTLALRALDRLQAQTLARDAARVWGPEHPASRPSLT